MSDFLINPTGKSDLAVNTISEREKPAQTGAAFSEILGNAIQEVNSLQAQAGDEVQKAMTGEINDIHTAMIAVQKADVSFQMMMQVRNKLVSAYQEIMKLQV
jgi:flagellar hook-basal body complex protein FliE